MITIAALSVGGLLPLLINLVIIGLIFYVVWWFLGYIALPEPFNKVCRVLIALIALILLVNALLGLTGNGFLTR